MPPVPRHPIRLHTAAGSGHGHRVELALSLLGLPCEKRLLDLRAGEHRGAAFLALNPFGQVPVIEDGALTLADSNAILVYLARRYDPEDRWLPPDPVGAAQVQRWLSVAAGELYRGPALARLLRRFRRQPVPPDVSAVARRLFETMEQHLEGRAFLAAPHATLADVALYSYSAGAPEGGLSLQPHPRLRAWLARVEALPGFVPLPVAGPCEAAATAPAQP